MASTFKVQNIFLFAFLSTLFLALGFVLFSFLWFGNIDFILQEKLFFISLMLLLLIGLSIFYWFSLKNQRRKDFTEISKNIPQFQSSTMDFEELSQKISTITEDQSKEIDVLNERENYRRDFLGNISHELKTPLFSVQGYLLTLIEGGVEDESIRDKYLNRINKSVDRLIYLVKDLDMIAELERGRINIEFSVFNLTALVQDVIDLLEIKAEKNNIKISLNYPIHQPIKVVGDIQKIQQVLINLIVNAINYSNPNTEIDIDFEEYDDKIQISIKDQGVGIKQEDIDRIFERFYRIDKSRNRNNGGSGLGLAIVKHILEAHKQKIYVTSKIGKGSTFSFYLQKA
ncbi:two-component sensor histidine kinase [Empedobacter falsenii]|uniref:histidine kinase n=1 Tax=Empedobacter falsenii TaxID=343874 RepID=A0A376J2R6_9FLAO|nr:MULTISPECIES: ATP-binding protein [Empedobacter]MBW1619084.1 two-component sensor histidine kinase [Empedobacter falsenii]MBY0067786.1 two-component sensor histidine kinase [Empedobacter falsenii]MDH0660429.1 ATP-binding protein [Empedobacter sp. GD03865]MDH0673144.1 ATP-binding protein [Empedobacter sp. GD03861]MDH1603923.1 ATP-binding protein [Empedobacter sp. GD03739]